MLEGWGRHPLHAIPIDMGDQRESPTSFAANGDTRSRDPEARPRWLLAILSGAMNLNGKGETLLERRKPRLGDPAGTSASCRGLGGNERCFSLDELQHPASFVARAKGPILMIRIIDEPARVHRGRAG